MDINRIKNTIIRRNLVEDVSRIKAKISEDNKRIVQIQVNRDTVLGELERQFAELKGDHERLQQNMLELQAQHEALSSQYEQELRHRAETLHKCEGTRKISEVLERGEEQAQLRFAQTKKDVAMIGEVYRQADLQVQNLMQTYVTKTAEAKQRYDKLKSQAKQMRIHELQLLEMYNENKNRVEATLREMCALQSHADELQRKYDVTSAELDKRNSEISTLQREKRNIINNINSQMTEANNILSKKDNDLKSAGEEIEALKKALANQEQFAKMQGDQNNELQEKMALMEEEHQKVIETNEKNYKTKIEESISICEKLNHDIEKLQEEKERLIKEMKYQQETINLYEHELELLKQQLSEYDSKLVKVTSELTSTIELTQKKNEEIDILDAKIRTLSKDLSDADTAFTKYRETAEEKLKHQAVIIEEVNNELALKTADIIQANGVIQSKTHACTELAVQIQKQSEIIEEIQRELEMQTSNVLKEKEERGKLETELQSKVVSIEEMTKELELKTATILKESEERSKLETDLQNKAVSIEEMTKELELKTATILKENEERSKLETDLQNKAVSIEEMKMELELKASTILTEKEERCKLETELINKTASIEEIKAEHTKLNATMETMKEYFDVQMDTAKENEKNLKEKVSRLESGIRTKDEELSRELGNFLSKRNEFEKEKRKLKEIIDGLERKIENIVKEASKTRPAEPRMQAELDDNAVMQLTSQSDQQRFAIFADSSDEWLPRASRSTKRPRPDPLVLGEPASQSNQRHFAIYAKSSEEEWLPRQSRPTIQPRPDQLVLGEPAAAAAAASTAAVAAPEKKTKERRFFKTARKPYKKR